VESHSAFSRTSLDEILQQEQVDRWRWWGVLICVLETVKELFDRDLPTLVYRDGVADFDPQAHVFALKHMQQVFGAQVV
jgi:nicotinamidase/pyrazinamidase